MNNKDNEAQLIALAIIVLAVIVAFGALIAGKSDEAIKQPVVLAMVSLISALVGLGGGILTSGKKGDIASNPQGSVTINTLSDPNTLPQNASKPLDVKEVK